MTMMTKLSLKGLNPAAFFRIKFKLMSSC